MMTVYIEDGGNDDSVEVGWQCRRCRGLKRCRCVEDGSHVGGVENVGDVRGVEDGGDLASVEYGGNDDGYI
jgi:hypothetical protein